MSRRHWTPETGTTLVEVLVASLVMIVGVVTMAQVLSIGTASTIAGRRTTLASVLAAQKLEELRPIVWTLPQCAGALRQNAPGCVDHVDAAGGSVSTAVTPPASTVYTRRWSIDPYTAFPNDVLIVQVIVTPHRTRGRADQGTVARLPDEARLVTMKARAAP